MCHSVYFYFPYVARDSSPLQVRPRCNGCRLPLPTRSALQSAFAATGWMRCFCCAAPVHERTVGKRGSPSRRWCWSTLRKPPPGWDATARETVAEATVQTKRVKHEEVLTRLNEYRIGREIGRGAYGTVLKARKPKQPEVAIKVAKRSALKRIRHGKGTALDSALREIAVMKRLSHPNVVQLIEVIDDPARDELYLVMELVTGGTLAEPIAKGQVSSEATLVRWMRDVALGLEHLHLSGVVHRDLKPENILWDKAAQRAKLADFGAAAICAEGPAGDYVRGTAGTPAFFAPEMCGDDSEMRGDESEMCGDDRTRARGYSGKVRPAYWWVVAGSASDKRACSHTSSMPVPVLTC